MNNENKEQDGPEKQVRGFLAMPEKTHLALASQGGSTTVKRHGKEYMRELGRKGGKNSHGGHDKHDGEPPGPPAPSVDIALLATLLEGAKRELSNNPTSQALIDAALALLKKK